LWNWFSIEEFLVCKQMKITSKGMHPTIE